MSHFSVLVALAADSIGDGLNFSQRVEQAVEIQLSPYCECTENPEFLVEETDSDGETYLCNPNATWDWYQIGGRWQGTLQVKADTKDIVSVTSSWDAEVPTPPDGFEYVNAARMRDISWAEMKATDISTAKAEYQKFSDILSGKTVPEGLIAVKEDGVYGWGPHPLLKRGETLDSYLERKGLGGDVPFAIGTYAFISKDGVWHSEGDMGWWAISTNNKAEESWNRECQEFFHSLEPDDVLVQVDCHI